MTGVDFRSYPIKIEHFDWEALKKDAAGKAAYSKELLYALNLFRFLRDRRDEAVRAGKAGAGEWEPFTREEFGAFCEAKKIKVNGLFNYLGTTMHYLVRLSSRDDAPWQVSHNLLVSLFSKYPAKHLLS